MDSGIRGLANDLRMEKLEDNMEKLQEENKDLRQTIKELEAKIEDWKRVGRRFRV